MRAKPTRAVEKGRVIKGEREGNVLVISPNLMPTWKPLLKKDDWGHFGCLFECGAQKKPGILIGPCMHCGLSWHPSCIAKRCKLNEEPTYKDTDCIVHIGESEIHITMWKCPICTVAFETGFDKGVVMAVTNPNQTGKMPTSQSGVGSKRNRAKVSDGASAFKYVCLPSL